MTNSQKIENIENTENTGTLQKIEEKNITDRVANRVLEMQATGALQVPENYSAMNALKSAWLFLQETKDRDKQPVLKSCSSESIQNALLDMIVQGLNPIKKQC